MRRTQKLFTLLAILTLLAGFSLAQEPIKQSKKQTIAPAATSNPVVGSGTAGQITKWAGVDGANTYSVGDSNITEDKVGKVGIGTRTPTSLLTVKGMIETTLGGYKFPDGTVQTTSAAGALFGVVHDATLQGNGTMALPLSVVQPIVGTQTTTLLFPFVTNQAGFETGFAITNTSMDTVGTTPQSGTCTINYFGTVAGGGVAPPAQTTNAPIPGGGQLTFVLSSGGNFGITGAPTFQGYIMATCNFQYAHGFALITDGPIGVARVGTSYLALIVPAGPRNPNGETLSK